ncbi:putative reverse transcriptase domain-containing protein [Tanacetum coccineum]
MEATVSHGITKGRHIRHGRIYLDGLKIESVFNIVVCELRSGKVCHHQTLNSAALTWWNGQIRTLGPEAYAMTWEGLKKKITDKYCPLANPDMSKFCANETESINKYIRGLPDNIYGIVKSSAQTWNETLIAKSDNDFKRDVPKLKNKDGWNGNAQGWVYAVGNAEKRGNASGNPDSNVITGTFLLNNHYASILFDTGADRSFISTAFSSLIDIVPTPLDNSYDVELADGKIVGIDTINRVAL